MQIVIDIEEKTYKRIQALARDDYFEHDICGYSMGRIANGKPLPKGHGDLIDVSTLLTVTDIKSDGSEFTYVPYSEIEDAPTIIERDKAESEE